MPTPKVSNLKRETHFFKSKYEILYVFTLFSMVSPLVSTALQWDVITDPSSQRFQRVPKFYFQELADKTSKSGQADYIS